MQEEQGGQQEELPGFPTRAAGPGTAGRAGAARGQARPVPSARLRRPVPRNVTPPKVTQKMAK